MTQVEIWLETRMVIQLLAILNLIIREHLTYSSQRIHLAVPQAVLDCRTTGVDEI
jgi:hypothetical protein